jgi:hypothetical protein
MPATFAIVTDDPPAELFVPAWLPTAVQAATVIPASSNTTSPRLISDPSPAADRRSSR